MSAAAARRPGACRAGTRAGETPHADLIAGGCSGADERRFQSFRLGVLHLGFCIHVAADEGHLHLQPAALLRFFEAPTASIPWSSIEIQKRSRTGKSITARINERTLLGPAWCLGLAEPTASETTGRKPATAADDATAGAAAPPTFGGRQSDGDNHE